MNKKKLKLESLKVKSFVTTMSVEEKNKVKAGNWWEMTYETDCDLSCLEECWNGYYSIELPCLSDQCQGGTGTCGCTDASADMEVCEW